MKHTSKAVFATLPFLIFLIFGGNALAADRVTLSGSLSQAACPAACGVCCGNYLLQDTSGQISLSVGNSFVDLTGITNGKVVKRFSGSFYPAPGQCGIGQCNLFVIEEIDKQTVAETVYDQKKDTLAIPSATISGTSDHFAVTLKPPFNIDSIIAVGKGKFAAQGRSCASIADQCATGLSCVSYFGIAGGSGPEFKTCEIPCAQPGAVCPSGQACVTVADGPGQVCQVIAK
jgi:hypothetical protein